MFTSIVLVVVFGILVYLTLTSIVSHILKVIAFNAMCKSFNINKNTEESEVEIDD